MPLPFTARSLDPDAAAFCARSGATDRAAINAFVRGVKDLGLWDKMVCWPLRSAQNAGNGDTVYSLGGLGTFNGTRVNGPAWTADGLTFDATDEGVQLPDNASLRNTRSGLAVFNSNDNSLNQQLIEMSSGGADGGYVVFRFDGQNFGGQFQSLKYGATRNGLLSQNSNGSRPLNLATWRTGAFTADDSTDNVFENGALAAGGARTGLSAINPTGTASSRFLFVASLAQTGAFAMTSTAKWSDSQVLALHNLYKSTLGTGLGLP